MSRLAQFMAFIAAYIALDWVSFLHPMHGLNIALWNPAPALGLVLWFRFGPVTAGPWFIALMYHRGGLTRSEIAGRSGLSSNTVKRRPRKADRVEPKYRWRPGDTKSGPYADPLLKVLESDARRPKRDRSNALKLFAELKAQGFDGDYTSLVKRQEIEWFLFHNGALQG